MSAWLGLIAASAFLAGLMGGVHCAAMCGGIVAAASGEKRGVRAIRFALAYNTGRIASYTLAGALVGALGQGALWLRGGPVVQQALLVAAGAALIALALYLGGVAPFMRAIETVGSVLWRRIQPYSRWFLPASSAPRALGLGLVWGWLPCGMVYAVALSALATGDALHGAFVMLAFGLGTLPNLLALSLFFERLAEWRRAKAVRLSASVLMAAFGVLGIVKALQPAAFAADGLLCQTLPGLSALLH